MDDVGTSGTSMYAAKTLISHRQTESGIAKPETVMLVLGETIDTREVQS